MPIRKFAPFLLLLALAGCASIGVPKPQTFNESALSAYSTVTAARDTTTLLLKAGKISATDAQNVQNQADNVREGIDIARRLYVTKPDDAQDKLTAALQILTVLNEYLAERQ